MRMLRAALIVPLLYVFVPMQVTQAAARISITSLYVTDKPTDIVDGKPIQDGLIGKVTTNLITLLATVEGFTDTDIAKLYLTITNVTTNKSIDEKSIVPTKQNTYDISFRNVPLTEGLNKIVVKFAGTTVVESAPGWVYFVSTTSINDLKINNEPYVEDKMFPSNTTQTTLNISGSAPNASEVRMHVYGTPTPINGIVNQGQFLFVADDINNKTSTANIKLRAGDNPITLYAKNATKSFQIERNVLYDNGKPFAFGAMMVEDGNKKPLIKNPVVTKPNVKMEAMFKVNLDTNNQPQTRYVELRSGSVRYGPYDLLSATPAESAEVLFPRSVYEGHSDTHLTLRGASLTNVTLQLDANDGSVANVSIPAVSTSEDASSKTFLLDRIDHKLLNAKAPYTIRARNGSVTLASFTMNVLKPLQTSLPTVTDATTVQTEQAGTVGTVVQKIQFVGAIADVTPTLTLTIANATGEKTEGTATDVTGYSANTTEVSYKLPSYLQAGSYVLRVQYGDATLTERTFVVTPAPPPPPTITAVTSSETYAINGIAGTKTHLIVTGANFGTTASAKLNNGVEQIGLTYVDGTATSAVFVLPDQSQLDDNSAYALELTVGTNTVIKTGAVTGKAYTEGTNTDGKTIVSVSPAQVHKNDIGTNSGVITVTGTKLNSTTATLNAQLWTEAGVQLNNAIISEPTASSAKIQLPGLTPGNYILRFTNAFNATTAVLAQYPLTVIDPNPTALNPSVRPVNAPDATADKALTLVGTHLGRDMSQLKLRFIDRNTNNVVSEKSAETLRGGTTAQFDAPTNIAKGAYTVQLLVNNTPVTSTLLYTVSAPPATLKENGARSRAGVYRVYDFAEQLELTSDRTQTLSVHFFNVSTDTIPPTQFMYYYENPNLPYIERLELAQGGASVVVSEQATTELNEQPAQLTVYANLKANNVNYYVGSYNENTNPTLATPAGNEPLLKKFTIPLQGLPSGDVVITIVPSTSTAATATKVGENVIGRKTVTLRVSSTPYAIVSNVFSGQIVKDVNNFTCTTPSNAVLAPCFTGRLVNVPISDVGNVDVYVNETKFTMSNTPQQDDFLDNGARFWFSFGANTTRKIAGDNLAEGKNTIRFVIHQMVGGARTPVSEATYDVFKFSGNAPAFLTLQPQELNEIVRYRPTNVANTYVTNESGVAFSGQFAGATEIKLTVRTVDPETKAPVLISDRRFGTEFRQIEPITNSPNLFTAINTPLAGQFTTRVISLASKGDTVFEFMITNSTNIVVTQTITITREPLPYMIVTPRVTRNAQGVDQANINSNYTVFEIIAEGANAVTFNKDAAAKRDIVDPVTKQKRSHFYYEVRNLKAGTNTVKFTVVRGDQQTNGTVILFHVNTSIEGAQMKTGLKNRITAFNNALSLTFQKNTTLMRNDARALNTYITVDRQLLLGIASSRDGRMDKFRHPIASEGQIDNPNPLIPDAGKLILSEPTGRFRAASPLYWIDAGTIPATAPDLREALTGSGRHPYDPEMFYAREVTDLVVPSQPGTLVLKYDNAVREDAVKYVTVYHFDTFEDANGATGSRWRNIGGVVNPANNTISVPIERFGFFQVMYMNQSFDDVITHPWARDQLDTLYARGIMYNKTSTNFVPNEPISRGEFATQLVKVFDLPLQYSETPSFSDVLRVNPLSSGLYDYKYIETAARAGIVRGQSGGRFMPDSSINRQDAAIMIARAAELKLEPSAQKAMAKLQKMFTDAATIDTYAQASVLAAIGKKFIEGKVNAQTGNQKATTRFDPEGTFTRAEAAEVLVRVLRDEGKLPK
jgi:hypothetical protein